MNSEKDGSLAEYEKISQLNGYYIWENSGSGKIIYISVLIFFCSFIISLPFIKVDISVSSPGIIRPVCEKTEITSLKSGVIEQIHCSEGTFIKKGQLLITLECSQIRDKFEYYKYENALFSGEIKDLTNLLAGSDNEMVSVKYRYERSSYEDQVGKVREQLQKARKEKERLNKLFKEKLISDKEYDDLSYAQAQIEKEIDYIVSSSMNRWQAELSGLKYQIERTRSEISALENELSQCEIIAPVSGHIDQLSGIYNGSVIYAGQKLATITPDTTLIGEFYVGPGDIGLLKPGQETIIIVDAFDYREWGVIYGRIKNIADDFILVNNQPVFRVRCSPEKDILYLKNGIKGQLKKGMTIQVRCIVTKSSVAHLIGGRLDRLLNPALNKKSSAIK